MELSCPFMGLCCEIGKDAVNSMVFRKLRGTDSMDTSKPFKWRHFQDEIILLCVRWYLLYPLSYRDLEEMMLERGLHIDHTPSTALVQSYAPELEKRCRPHLKVTNDSWRVDETYIKVKKVWMYLYRAIDSQGNTLEFLLSPTRDASLSQALLRESACCAPYQHSSSHHG
jgi:transposase, IS6 family